VRRAFRLCSVAAILALVVGLAAQVPVHHPIATGSPTAQAAFDRGLALVYAFNFRAAEAAFRQASAKDPTEPMPYWGLALGLGPNLNARQPSPAAARNATDALAKARELAASLPEDAEGAEERGYIEALTLRLSCDPHPAYLHLESAYGEAMQRLAATYPSDPDAATLYAESLMEQRGWRAWIHGGGSSLPSGEVLAALARVLQRWPDHLGANHLYIHATDGAGHPERALESAAVSSGWAPRFRVTAICCTCPHMSICASVASPRPNAQAWPRPAPTAPTWVRTPKTAAMPGATTCTIFASSRMQLA